jgi:hypothetical protein
VIRGEGSLCDIWLAESIRFLDVTSELLLKQQFLISYYSKGGFSFDETKRLTTKKYDVVLKEALRVQRISTEENNGN